MANIEELGKYRNAIIAKNEKDKSCLQDYIKYIICPSPDFDELLFFTKASLLIEQEIKEFLEKNNKKSKVNFFKLIEYISKIHIDDELWNAIHNIRKIRNSYAHELKNEDKKDDLINNFISHAEKINDFDGLELFPIDDYENQRSARSYYLFTIVWETLCRLNGASSDFSPSRSWLNEYIDTILDHVGKTRDEVSSEKNLK